MYRNCQSFSMVITYQMQSHKRELRNAINYIQSPVLNVNPDEPCEHAEVNANLRGSK